MVPRPSRLLVAALIAVTATGCGDDGPEMATASTPTERPATASAVDGVEVPDGFAVEEVVTGLDRPTQISFDADGRLLVAELAGGEGDGTGRVLRLDLAAPDDREVLAEDLVTPTGVTEADGVVWVMEQRRLSRIGADGTLEVVLDELPFNGRSEGTLTTTPEGELLYHTSGTLDGNEPAAGSGSLFSLGPDDEPELLAEGLKNGYARTYDAEGRLWSVEMSDGSFDGGPAPDEVMLLEPGADFGWPRCIGDGTPVDQYGGTDESCASSPPSLTLFDPGATPTSIAVAPWDEDILVVALWNQGRVVTVPMGDPAPDEPVASTTFLTGIEHPQHLLVDGDRLLVVDHDGGRILAVTAAG